MPTTPQLGMGMVVQLEDKFSAVARQAEGSAKRMAGSFGVVSKSLGGLSSGVGQLAKLAGLGVGLHQAVIDPLASVMDYRKGAKEVQNLLHSIGGRTGPEIMRMMDEITQASRGMAVEMGLDVMDLLKAYWQSFSTGAADVRQATQWVRGAAMAHKTYGAEMATVIKAVTTVYDNFGNTQEEMAAIAGKLAAAQGVGALNLEDLSLALRTVLPYAKALNVPWEEATALLTGLTRGTGNAAESATKLRAVMGTLLTLRVNPQAQASMHLLGLNINAANVKAWGLKGTLDRIAERAAETPFQKIGVDVKTLGLSFKAADMQGKGLYRAAAELAAAMEGVGGEKVQKALRELGFPMRNVAQFMQLPIERKGLALAGLLQKQRGAIFTGMEDMPAYLALTNKLGQAPKAFAQALKSMAEGGDLVKRRFKDALESPFAKLARLKASVAELKLKLGEAMLPGMDKLFSKLLTLNWDKIGATLGKFLGDLAMLLPRIIAALDRWLPKFQAVKPVLAPAWKLLSWPAKSLTKAIGLPEAMGDMATGAGLFAAFKMLLAKGGAGVVAKGGLWAALKVAGGSLLTTALGPALATVAAALGGVALLRHYTPRAGYAAPKDWATRPLGPEFTGGVDEALAVFGDVEAKRRLAVRRGATAGAEWERMGVRLSPEVAEILSRNGADQIRFATDIIGKQHASVLALLKRPVQLVVDGRVLGQTLLGFAEEEAAR
jgi:hypothetical protein